MKPFRAVSFHRTLAFILAGEDLSKTWTAQLRLTVILESKFRRVNEALASQSLKEVQPCQNYLSPNRPLR